MKALVYTRPRTREYFHFLADRLFGSQHTEYVTDHKLSERACITAPFYRYYRRCSDPWAVFAILSNEEVRDVVERCRFLRSLPNAQALRMVYAMWRAAEDLLDERAPDLLLSLPIDNYVLDVMERVARARGIPYAGLVSSFVNGFFCIENRGILTGLRAPSDEEVRTILAKLQPNSYLPAYIARATRKKKRDLLVLYAKEKIKRVGFFALRRALSDPLNFQYNQFRYVQRMSCDSLRHVFVDKYFDTNWISRLERAGSALKVYMPLQFYPEVTTDYWTKDRTLIHFYEIIERILHALPDDALAFMKEHPSAAGYRPPSFYRSMRCHANAVLVPFSVPSNSVLELCDVTLTWGTTAGIEARIRGKPVVTIGTPYYFLEECFAAIHSEKEIDSLADVLLKAVTIPRECDAEKLIRRVLSACLPGRLQPVDFVLSASAESDIQAVAKSLEDVLTEGKLVFEDRTGRHCLEG